MTHMSFGRALELLRGGHHIHRFSWGNRTAYLTFIDGSIMIHMSIGGLQAWNPTQGDLLAEDWGTVDQMSGSPMDLNISGDGEKILADNRTLRDPTA